VRRTARLCLLLIGCCVATCGNRERLPAKPASEQPAFAPAYPPSPVITGVRFDDASARELAPGSDLWPITWAADGSLYTVWGDGGGFGGSDRDGRVSLGVARVEGGRRDYRGVNVAGGVGAARPAPFAGKSEGILALGDTLYLWRDGEGGRFGSYFDGFSLWRSDDRGASWRETGVRFGARDGDFPSRDAALFAPAFCQFGPGYTGARDEYVYVYAPDVVDASNWWVRKPGRIHLMRVARAQIERKSAYEFYAGGTNWTHDPKQRKPVWQDAQGTHRMAVSFNAPLRRYLLTTITHNRDGWMSIYDAPEPWGPWTHVHTEFAPERWGSYTILFSFVNPWLSADGRDFVLVHTKNDRWATIEGRFEVSTPAGP
jgi:hypothetical protein